MIVTKAKQAPLLGAAAELSDPLAALAWTTRELDSIKGRLLHYSVAIGHLLVLVAEL